MGGTSRLPAMGRALSVQYRGWLTIRDLNEPEKLRKRPPELDLNGSKFWREKPMPFSSGTPTNIELIRLESCVVADTSLKIKSQNSRTTAPV
jgi:hypothetical protein